MLANIWNTKGPVSSLEFIDYSFYYSYLGVTTEPYGVIFEGASDSRLQAYIDQHNDTIDLSLHLKWRHQAAEAIH